MQLRQLRHGSTENDCEDKVQQNLLNEDCEDQVQDEDSEERITEIT